MSESSLVTLGLAFLVPLGFALIAVGALPGERSRRAAVAFFAAMGLAVAGYVSTGFALQFGGVGLAHNLPGFEGLIWEWSALGPNVGAGLGHGGTGGLGSEPTRPPPPPRTLWRSPTCPGSSLQR